MLEIYANFLFQFFINCEVNTGHQKCFRNFWDRKNQIPKIVRTISCLRIRRKKKNFQLEESETPPKNVTACQPIAYKHHRYHFSRNFHEISPIKDSTKSAATFSVNSNGFVSDITKRSRRPRDFPITDKNELLTFFEKVKKSQKVKIRWPIFFCSIVELWKLNSEMENWGKFRTPKEVIDVSGGA